MKKRINRLIDVLNSMGHHKEASKLTEWLGKGMPEPPKDSRTVSFTKDDGTKAVYNIGDSSLFRKLENIIYKIIAIEDPRRTSQNIYFSRKEVDDIFSDTMKLDQNLNTYSDHKDNMSAITPQQFAEIVSNIYQHVASKYPGGVELAKSVDGLEAVQVIREFLINQYFQVYIENYLGREPEAEDYPGDRVNKEEYQIEF